jgi:hypothetical protein
VWNLDGVNITDMAATGSTGTYYDFDSFQEISATTGGSDITQMTPGVQLNLVTKRATNDVHGSARVYDTRGKWQSQNAPAAVLAQAPPNNQGVQITEVQDYGVEVGGPLWKDRAWLWGAYGRNQVDLIQTGNVADKTTLIDANLKLNLQPIESTSVTLAYTQGEKDKFGRNGGVTRPPETAWNQAGFNGLPSASMKAEVSEVFSSAMFMTANYSYFRGGFQLVPASGFAVNNTFQDSGGVWHNSYLGEFINRPLHNVGASGSYFFNAGAVGNELKYGFSYRNGKSATTVAWPGDGNYLLQNPFGTGLNLAVMTRPAFTVARANWYNGYLGDVVTTGNLTVNLGVRYDVQNGFNEGAAVGANPIIPDILPALSPTNSANTVDWKNWQPRVGLTYAVGSEKKLLLKASYARFADQLGFSPIEQTNATGLAGIEFYTTTQPGQAITRASLDTATGVPCGPTVNCQGFYGFDPNNPTSLISPNFIQNGFKAGVTDEGIAGFDYEVIPEFVVGASYSYRRYTGSEASFPNGPDGTLYNGTNWSALGPVSVTNGGVTYTIPNVYGLNTTTPTGATILNRPNYDTTYSGIELTFQKRLSNNWMVRGNFDYQDWKQSAPMSSCANPNNVLNGVYGGSCVGSNSLMVGPSGTGSGAFGNVFVNSKWNFNISGLYQLPLGFNVGANFYGRQGYPRLQWISVNAGDGLGGQNVLVGNIGDQRYPNLFNVDFRLEKAIDIKPLQINLSIDVFNLANSGTVLQRLSKIGSVSCSAGVCNAGTATHSYNTITEIQSPRVVRAGARISF